uniref:Slc35c-2 n=1 Tax=Schmidtea mediterranea TaxID=79327 RepID=A0A0H3YJC9_SCHMD|nr:slc35c-2 [Schmidtea mediterranea]
MKVFTFNSYHIQVISAVSLYWFISISLVFLNKYLLSSNELKLNAPLFITWFQCSTSVILCLLLSYLSQKYQWFYFPRITFEFRKTIKILPLSVMMLMMITCNNYALKLVNVSFYFIGRSLTTVFNVIFTYLLLKTSTSLKVMVCCAVIIFGFWLGVDQEEKLGSLSWKGVLFGVASSAFVALNAIYTKKKISVVNDDVWKLCFYNNINAAIIFFPLIFFTGEFDELKVFPYFFRIQFWLIMIISGVFGFAIGYVTGLQIQVTSPLSHTVSGTAKACAQTIIAYFIFSEIKSSLWWCSNIIVMGGSLVYALVRNKELKERNLQIPK